MDLLRISEIKRLHQTQWRKNLSGVLISAPGKEEIQSHEIPLKPPRDIGYLMLVTYLRCIRPFYTNQQPGHIAPE